MRRPRNVVRRTALERRKLYFSHVQGQSSRLNVVVAVLMYITAITAHASPTCACNRKTRAFSGTIPAPVFRTARIHSKSSCYCLLMSGTAILETAQLPLSSKSTSIFDCRHIGSFLMSYMIATPIADRKQDPLQRFTSP